MSHEFHLLVSAGERDDLKALLMASLQRLEAVDRVVQRVDQSNAAMEEHVSTLEHEKNKASEAAATAQAQVEALLKSQHRAQWQNKVNSTHHPCCGHDDHAVNPGC